MLFCMILFVILVHATPDVFWRLPCEQPTGYGRIDPIQSPGHASQHTHVIFGSGSTFLLQFDNQSTDSIWIRLWLQCDL